jgi:hypothetical protein
LYSEKRELIRLFMAGNAVALKFADLESLPASPTRSAIARLKGRAAD